MSLPNEDNNDGTDDDPDLRMPYRKRKRFHETTPPTGKWREACYRLYPNLDSLSEEQKEAIESRIKVEYYIALGLDSSLPRTATSGSIETPKVSPLLQNTPRVPSRVFAPLACPIEPVEPLSPLALLPSTPIQSQSPPLLPVAPSATLSPLPPLTPLSPLPLETLPSLVNSPTNPYFSSFYQPCEEKPLITSNRFQPLGETFVKPEEDNHLQTGGIKEPQHKSTKTTKPLEDYFIKPKHPVTKRNRDPFLEPPDETYTTRFQGTSIGDQLLKRTASSLSNLEASAAAPPKRAKKDFFFEPIADSFKRVSTTELAREPKKRDYRYPYRHPAIQTEDPFSNIFGPSTSAFSVPKLAQSSSMYVDCPTIPPNFNIPIHYIDLREEIANNNNDDSVNNYNNEETDEPIDYSLNHS